MLSCQRVKVTFKLLFDLSVSSKLPKQTYCTAISDYSPAIKAEKSCYCPNYAEQQFFTFMWIYKLLKIEGIVPKLLSNNICNFAAILPMLLQYAMADQIIFPATFILEKVFIGMYFCKFYFNDFIHLFQLSLWVCCYINIKTKLFIFCLSLSHLSYNTIQIYTVEQVFFSTCCALKAFSFTQTVEIN